MSPLNITQPLGIWSTRWLLFQVMSNIPKMGQLPTPGECPDNLALCHVYTVLYQFIPWLYHCLIGGYWGKVSQRFHMIWDFNIEKALLEHCLWLQVNWFNFDKTELFTAIQDILLNSLYILLSSLWAEFRIWSWIKVTLSRRISIFENIRTLFLENLLYLIV